MALASRLREDSTFDAIKVVQEDFDENSGRFQEKTLFSHIQNQDSSATAPPAKAANGPNKKSGKMAKSKVARRPTATADRLTKGRSTAAQGAVPPQATQSSGSKSVSVMVGLAFLLIANVGFAVLFADRLGLTGFDSDVNTLDTVASEKTDRFYDLPAVTTNFLAADGQKIIHIRLGLKIENDQREKAIDARLTAVVTGLLADLNRMELKEHSGMVNIEILKKRLKKTVENISDEAIDEIMLKEIVVF